MADTILDTRATKFDRFLDNDRFIPNSPDSGWNLTIDMYEQRGNVIAKMALPTMNPDNLEISVDEDSLRISGRRDDEKETRNKDYTSKIVHSESFSRVVDLPKTVDASRASAQYRDGLLQVTMPVASYTKERPVRVNIEK